MRMLIRHITGYFIGVSFFVILIPCLFFLISRLIDPLTGIFLFSELWVRLVISLPIFCIGVLFAIWSNVSLFVQGKGGPTDVFNYAISPRSQHLVVSGPYRYTRNPMVFGMLSIWISLSVFLNSFIDLMVCFIIIPLVIIYLRRNEETRLLNDFGEDFIQYRSTVPMIFPVPYFLRNLFTSRHKKKE